MKVGTWNIGGGFIYGDNKVKYDIEDISYFIDGLKVLDLDILFLQEAHMSVEHDQPSIIAKGLGLDYLEIASFSDSHIKEGEKLCISIISKYPIISSRIIDLINPNLSFEFNGKRVKAHNKGLLEIQISYDNISIAAITGQMYPFRKFGENLLDSKYNDIRSGIEEVILNTDLPTIVGCDMNFQDVYSMLPEVFNEGFTSSLNDNPTTPRNRAYAKVLLSKHWQKSEGDIIKGKADHYLCTVDTEFLNLD